MDLNEAIALPLEIQISLAAGYAAYLIAFTGLRANHRTVDTVFIALIFSSIALLTFRALFSYGIFIAAPTAFVLAMITGVGWRKSLRNKFRAFLRHNDVSWSNDDHSAISTLCDNDTNRVSQVSVKLDNGSWLRCDDTSLFESLPNGPFILGPSGDIALYLTHEDEAGGISNELKTVRDVHYGDRITYVPANRVTMINIRYAPA